MFSVDWYACDIVMPSSLVYEPWYTTSLVDGTKNSARYVPVSSRITNDHSAISPSMNDQWSGKTFRIRTRTPRAPWNLSSSHPPTPLSAFGIFTAFVAHPRSQKLGPTGCVKSLAAARYPSQSTVSGSCGSGRGAGPKITLAPFVASNVDWWHGHRMWCVVCSYSATGQPTCVQILE